MNQRDTWILLGVFALVLGVFFYTRNEAEKKQAEAPPTPGADEVLWPGLAKEDIARIRLDDNETGAFLLLQKKQEIWSVVYPLPRLAEPSKAVSLASELASLRVTRTLTETTDLNAFGVLNPHYTFEVTKGDGTKLRVDIGSQTPVGSDYYALRQAEANAVVLAGYSVDAILRYVKDPPYPPTPTPAFAVPTEEAAATPAP